MLRHALAFVKWKVFRHRAREGRPERSFFYACPNRRLVERVGSGGTLWVVTRKPGKGHYSLAFKLANCRRRTRVPRYISRNYGPTKRKDGPTYLVVSEDWDACQHYPYNNASIVLNRLRFVTGMTLAECKPSGRGSKLLTIPEVEPKSALLLEAFALRQMSKRRVFLSYSRRDRGRARRLVRELERRDVKVSRDIDRLLPSDMWAKKLEQEVKASDVVLVLATRNSAASKWVGKEIDWARSELEQGGCVRRILPLKVPDRSWQKFTMLHDVQFMRFPLRPSRDDYERLARTLAILPRRRHTGWDE
jgi:hypothetical protein